MKFNSVLLSGFLALCSISFATAQNDVSQSKVSIGVRGGVTLPNLTGGSSSDPVSNGYSTATRFGAGIFAEIKFSELFSLQPMLEYSQEGAKRNGMQALLATGSNPDLYGLLQQAMPALQQMGIGDGSIPSYLYSNANRTAKMDYLMLPVLAKFGWNLGKSSPWRVYVSAGPYVGLLLNAKNIVTGNGLVYTDKDGNQSFPPTIPPAIVENLPPAQQQAVQQLLGGMQAASAGMFGNQDIKKQLNTFNWGLEGNVGIQYQFNRNRVFLEVGGNYGLMHIQKSTGNGQYLNGKNNIGAATVMIGYAYSL